MPSARSYLIPFLSALAIAALACAGPGDDDDNDDGGGGGGGGGDGGVDGDGGNGTDTEVECPIQSDDFTVRLADVGDDDGCGASSVDTSYYADAVCTGDADGSWLFTIEGILTTLSCTPTTGDEFACEGENDEFRVSAEGFVSEYGQRFEGQMTVTGNCEGVIAFIAVAD